MAQKEDILEQIVEEFLIHEGYFVQRNIRYKPAKSHIAYESQKDSVSSDIDILAIHPLRAGPAAVYAVNIKSWQQGFDFKAVLEQIASNKKISGRESILRYRELAIPKWSEAFIDAIMQRTGKAEFTHVLAVTLAKGDRTAWESNPAFRSALRGNPLQVLTLQDMIERIEPSLTTTPAATDIGRTLQLFRAAGLRPKPAKAQQ